MDPGSGTHGTAPYLQIRHQPSGTCSQDAMACRQHADATGALARSLHVEEKKGTKMKKKMRAGWRRGPWQRHPRHSPLPANPAPTQWYVLTRCHGMPATCKMPPARSPHNAQECPKIAHTVPWHAGNIQNATGAPAPQCPRVPHNCANTHPGSHAWRFPHAGAAHCTSTE